MIQSISKIVLASILIVKLSLFGCCNASIMLCNASITPKILILCNAIRNTV